MAKFESPITGVTKEFKNPNSIQETNFSPNIKDTNPEIILSVDKLPSLGKAYPANSTISYRPYTFGEIKKINQSKLDIYWVDFVLEGINSSFPKGDITLGDFLYIGFLRKISTVGSKKFKFPYECKECKTKNEEIIDSAFEFVDIRAPKLPVKADFSCGELSFMPITVKQFKSINKLGLSEDPIAHIAIQVTNQEYESVYKFIESLSGKQMMLLNKVEEYLAHAMKPLIFKCKSCNTETKVELDREEALILPFRGDEESIDGAIHFG